MKQINRQPYRLGTSSYIIPDEILPNVRYLADKVDDVELVLFEVDDGPNNVPTPEIIAEMITLAEQWNLTYTVHLPLDIKLGNSGEDLDVSMRKARKVIECTRPLKPAAYVLHLDGHHLRDNPPTDEKARWLDQAVESLRILGGWTGDIRELAVENLESYPIDFWDEIFVRTEVSRCIDIGHLWLDHVDPIPYLEKNLSRARVLHIHGIDTRDHQSLRHIDSQRIQAVFDYLHTNSYSGVLTLEVFGEDDFLSSLQVLPNYD